MIFITEGRAYSADPQTICLNVEKSASRLPCLNLNGFHSSCHVTAAILFAKLLLPVPASVCTD